MTEFKETVCRLCLKNITDKEFKIIDSVTTDILDVLLLKLKFYGESQEVICSSCEQTLKTVLDFKLMCLNTNNMIIPYIDCEKMLQVDLREIYIKENKSIHVTSLSCNDKICRLCIQPIKGEIRAIGEQEREAIQKFVPEMNIMIIKDPVLCKSCFDSLCSHNNFIKDCLEVDQRITDIFESSAKDCKTYASSSDIFIKAEHLQSEDFEMNVMEMAIKTECVDIKTEEDDGGDPQKCENSDCKPENQGPKDIRTYNNRSIDKCSAKSRKKDSFTLYQFKDCLLYKCDKCIYETKSKIRFTGHCMKHKNVSDVYKCETCEYETRQKRLLKNHILKHIDLLEVQMYRCHDCDYKTKYKSSIQYHVLQHRNASQVQMYKCNFCDSEYRRKDSYIKHQLAHKDPSEVRTYRCNECEYKTKYKNNIQYHILQHKDTSQVLMYKCDACDYESRHKNNFIKHQLIHKDPSEVQMYRCNDCDYKTKYKRNIRRHVIKHKDPSRVQMYKCNSCGSEFRHKDNCIKHQLTHKDLSDTQMFSCNYCDYKTKYKRNIGRHAIKHRDTSQVQIYKCNACDYESRYKSSVITHQVIHTDPL